MADKAWRTWPYDQCPHCGTDVEVFTDAPEEMVVEGDNAQCVECGCPGVVGLEDDYDVDNPTGFIAYVTWHDDPDCRCAWCRKTFPKK